MNIHFTKTVTIFALFPFLQVFCYDLQGQGYGYVLYPKYKPKVTQIHDKDGSTLHEDTTK